MFLNSGYRNPQGNSNVGGKVKSWHMTGKAADIDTHRIFSDGRPPYGRPYWRRLWELVKLDNEIDYTGREVGTEEAVWDNYDGALFHIEPRDNVFLID